MSSKRIRLALLASTFFAAPALAEPGEAHPVGDPTERIAQLEAQMAAMQKQVEELKKQTTSAAPSWRGAPQFTGSGGWSYKPRGRLQYDAGWVEQPEGVNDLGLGFSNEIRRARLGVEGTVPGGFGYKFEVDFAGGDVEFADTLISYQAAKRLAFTVGQHNPFQSLEELTSSRFSTFIERAAFTDAFNFERRVGLSAQYSSGPVIVQAGAFTDSISDLANDENNSRGVDARVVYAPKFGTAQLHLGASAHYRDTSDLAVIGPATRYRQRPLLHTTDTRFIGTPALQVSEETNYGVEAAVIRGPFHAAGELHWLNADLATLPNTGKFFGGYAEIGYYLTGETRGYRGGIFERTKVLKPLGGGGFGALQLNLRYDHLDLSGGNVIGGRQDGYMASLIWIPQDYVRFLLNYGHLRYNDAAIPVVNGNRSYSVNVVGARAQIDF